MLWFGLIIPGLLIVIMLTFKKLRERTVWWEIAIPAVATVLTIVICQWAAVSSAVRDKEFWGHMSYKITHSEPFAYDSECPETYQCGTSCDSKGHCTPQYCTRWVHCVENSPRRCYIKDDQNKDHYISYAKYKELAKRWNNFGYETHEIVTESHGYTTHGDKYNRPEHGNFHSVTWDKSWETSEPLAIIHTYENKLQTQSHWKPVNEKILKEYNIYNYPLNDGGWEAQTILSTGMRFPKADKYLRYVNGHLNTTDGGYKRVRLWVLVFVDQPKDAAEAQRQHWKGGNKNEFTIMLGVNKEREVTWFDIMTWSESDILTIETRDAIQEQLVDKKLDDENMLSFAMWLEKDVRKKYIKPDFRKYDYISVQPSMNAILISYIIIFVVNIGMGFFIYFNPWAENNGHFRSYRRHRFR